MEVSSGTELFMLQALRWSNAIEATCFWLILLFQDEDGGRLFCTDITEGRLKRSSWSCFILSLTKDLFLLCFVILHWSSQNQRKLGWGALFFFFSVVLFALTFLFSFFVQPPPLLLQEPVLLPGPSSLMKSKGCQSMPPTQKGIWNGIDLRVQH